MASSTTCSVRSGLLGGNSPEEVRKVGIHTEAKHFKVNGVILMEIKGGKLRSDAVSDLLEVLLNTVIGTKREAEDSGPYLHPGELRCI